MTGKIILKELRETGVPADSVPSTSKDAGRPNESHSTKSVESEDGINEHDDIQEVWPIKMWHQPLGFSHMIQVSMQCYGHDKWHCMAIYITEKSLKNNYLL